MPRNYESIRTEAISTRRNSDQNDYKLGDLANELEDMAATLRDPADTDLTRLPSAEQLAKEARALVCRLADDIGVPHKSLIIRARISRRVNPLGILGWIRDSTLTFAVLRELYALESDDDVNTISKKAISQNMTVREVRTEMESYRDGKAVAAGLYLCQTCSESIQDEKEMVVVAKHGKRLMFCTWNCAAIYTTVKAQEEGPILQLTTEQVDGKEDTDFDPYDFSYDESVVEMAL